MKPFKCIVFGCNQNNKPFIVNYPKEAWLKYTDDGLVVEHADGTVITNKEAVESFQKYITKLHQLSAARSCSRCGEKLIPMVIG